jgi:hypothetical protein
MPSVGEGMSGGLTALMDSRRRCDCSRSLLSLACPRCRGDAPGYSGGAAIPKRLRQEDAIAPPREQDRFAVDLSACVVRASQTLASQSHGRPGTAWDFHRSVKSAIVIRRHRQTPRVLRERTRNPSPEVGPGGTAPVLHHLGEIGTHTRPKRDASRTVPTRPLRHRPLPCDAGCGFPWEVDQDFWTRTVSPR